MQGPVTSRLVPNAVGGSIVAQVHNMHTADLMASCAQSDVCGLYMCLSDF